MSLIFISGLLGVSIHSTAVGDGHDRRADRIQVAHVDRLEVHTPRHEHPVHQPVRAAVDVVAHDDP